MFGTVFGTILGWLLKYLQDNIGKLVVIVDGSNDTKSKNKQYALNVKVFICNHSLQEKYIKNLKVLYYCKKSVVLRNTPKINSNMNDFNSLNNKTNMDNIVILKHNIPKEYILCDIITEKFNVLSDVDRITISYDNTKGKTKEIVVKSDFRIKDVADYSYGNSFPM